MGEEEIAKMAVPAKPSKRRTLREDFKEQSMQESMAEARRRMEYNQNMESLLSRLEAANAEDDEANELDPAIFDYYKGRK
jgi:hypothetical protein